MECDLYALHERGNKMSLLTEEQVLDLTAAILDTNGIIYWRVKKWNDKQQPAQPLAQFEPDWSKAPKDATSAALDLSWWITEYGNWSNSKRIATYERPAPVITPHPHAALMVKYAEIAARRRDPWVEFELNIRDDYWMKCNHPIDFLENNNYRHIGETK